ncbi:MAG: flavodoxin family protein [Syntrophobacterales bacterium]|jgi:NAD(P)H-dependent FMN reductase|nr:flavodoxin family protein [Syntrophobacterales bacterium]
MMNEENDLTRQNEKVILALIGSPRKLGNCEVLVKEISERLETAHVLKLIRMPPLNIRSCSACYGCIMDQVCPQKDDMNFLLDHIAEADGYIIASPVYFLGAHSIFKRILDRGFLLYNILESTYGKPCILLNLYGMEERIGAAPHTLMTLASFLGLRIKASVNVKAALPGEVLLDKKIALKARKLANDLFSEAKERHAHGCPFCGCEIVRMDKKEFCCTLCHGRFMIGPSGKPIRVREGKIFGAPEYMLLHKTWLSGMKQEFLKTKKEILRTTLPYKDTGEWIVP